MEEHHAVDDQSHYEISLTAGQAFVAFVLLLLSLAASFAFGLMLGKGQADERLVVRKETPVVTEASVIPGTKKNQGEIVELSVADDEFVEPETETAATATAAIDTTETAVIHEEPAPAMSPTQEPPVTTTVAAAAGRTASQPVVSAPAAGAAVPHIAQLLSTGDQKIAEALAVKVINRGFNTAYVERGSTDKGPVYRVRVRFDSEAEARAAEAKLREFSKEVWITAK